MFNVLSRKINLGEIPEDVLENAGFDHYDQWIVNPTVDPTGRFPLSKEEAEEIYGKENIETFLGKVETELNKCG